MHSIVVLFWALFDPTLPTVNLGNQHVPLDQISLLTQSPNYKEYLELRDSLGDNRNSAQHHLKLANWCEKHRLPNQARAHLQAADRLRPNDPMIQKRLDRRLVRGKWVDESEQKARNEEVKGNTQRSRGWNRKLAAILKNMDRHRDSALDSLHSTLDGATDPALVPVIEQLMLDRGEVLAGIAIKTLSGIPHQDATVALVRCAIYLPWEKTQQQAVSALKERRQQDYLCLLIHALEKPRLESNFQVQSFNNGVGLTIVQSLMEQLTDVTEIQPPASLLRALSRQAGGRETAYQQAGTLRRAHAESALKQLTGLDLGNEKSAWLNWYFTDIEPVGQLDGESVLYFQVRTQRAVDTRTFNQTTGGGGECFSADTLVTTERGLVRIDKIQEGDLVLSQDMRTGQLALKAVIRKTQLGSNVLRQVMIGSDEIRPTEGHLFFVPNRGWVPAKDLQPGQLLLAPSASLRIDANTKEKVELVHNLEVADFHTFFVGKSQLLVHDIRPIDHDPVDLPGKPSKKITQLELDD